MSDLTVNIRHKPGMTRFNGREVRKTREGVLYRLRYHGSCTADVLITWHMLESGQAAGGVGCLMVCGEALEAVQTAIAWDKDLRAESKRLG